MEANERLTERSQKIRQAMQSHVAERLTKELAKWSGKTDAQSKKAIQAAHEKYQLARILEKGVKANGMAIATHIAKGLHPDLNVKRHTNLLVRFDKLPRLDEVGSHGLRQGASIVDATGDSAHNPAAYELHLLLCCEIDGVPLMDALQSGDQDALDALAMGTPDAARFAADVLALLADKCTSPRVDARGKQIYWCAGGDPLIDPSYRLLAPLYPASLVHEAYLKIQQSHYGKENAAARLAKRAEKLHDRAYEQYRNLATRKMGGAHPKNISHLNNERRGYNYLLESLPPPEWKASQRYLPLHAKSIFDGAFNARPAVKKTVKAFRAFLLIDPPANQATAQQIEDHLDALVDEMTVYAVEMQSQPPGWTLDERYEDLAELEKLWLDPRRADLPDEAEFARQWQWMDWPAEVAKRFAQWLNAQLQGKLPVGDAEMREWRKALLADDRAWAQDLRERRGEMGAPNSVPFRKSHDELVAQGGGT